MTDQNDLFIRASRRKFRFESVRGDLTTEDLWDLPLVASNGFSLDAVGRTAAAELKGLAEESFVETKADPRKGELEAMVEIVRFIIATKQAEALKAQTRAARADERRKLLDAIAAKDDEALSQASRDQLVERLAALDEDADAS